MKSCSRSTSAGSRLLFFLPFPGCGLRLTFRRIVGRSHWSNIVLHFGSGVRIFSRFLLCGGGAWPCPRSLWRRLIAFFRLRKKTRTRHNWSRRLRSPRSGRTRRPCGLWRANHTPGGTSEPGLDLGGDRSAGADFARTGGSPRCVVLGRRGGCRAKVGGEPRKGASLRVVPAARPMPVVSSAGGGKSLLILP